MRFWPTVFLLPLFSNLCLAQDNEANATWYGSIDAGYIASMGTTSGSKDTFRGKTSLNHKGLFWTQTISAEGISVQDDVASTADTERYLASYKARHFFGERNFFTLRAQWEKDVLSASEYQAFVSLGLGKEVIKTQNHFFKVEAGPGLRHNERRLATPKDDPIALLSLDYDWKISANTKFSHKSTVEAGEDSVITRVQHQLKQNITKVVALTVNHDYKNDNGAINTREGVFSLGLNYQF
jgi:putative salt-induced outer membrane protein